MAKTILVVDEADKTLGSFFQLCMDGLNTFFITSGIESTVLNSNKLNELSIQVTTEPLESFVFGAYSHGGMDCLVKLNIPYISTTLNNLCFKNSFFYTFSCSCGHELGKNLIDNGCLCFIGYKDDVAVWINYLNPFVECANHGLIQFFKGENTFSIISAMTKKYNDEIDAIYLSDSLIASILRENRDALIIHGHDINISHI